MNNGHLKCGLRNAECGIKNPKSEIRDPRSSGMTLIEVTLVLVIIGILSAVVVTKLDIGMTTSRASVDGAA
jgi:prepilin-type N-terminal cleavage/methylation domain-containing protein